MRILFLHGLEGSPRGKKAQWLSANYDTTTPALNTRAARSFLGALKQGASIDETPSHIFAEPTQAARASLTPDIELVIGSSFGGALLGHLVEQSYWKGPCIFLASAHVKLGTLAAFVGASICIHGASDTVVPSDPVRAFVEACGEPHQFWGIDDNHSLGSIRHSGLLAKAIASLA